MSFVPQITCRNCGKKFSALRGRCPKCGVRHVKQTLRTTPASTTRPKSHGQHAAANAKWQMIFGGILIVAVIVAVIILITASLNPTQPSQGVETPPLAEVSTPPPPTPSPTPEPSPTVAVTSVTITFLGRKAPDSFTQRTSWNPIQLGADVYPREALTTSTVIWRSSNNAVATVDETGLLTAVGSGSCEIIAECGGIAASVTVLVP